ncbi:hypothetical protein CYMTET_34099, partial [Cymbomonas tetramitiformis]
MDLGHVSRFLTREQIWPCEQIRPREQILATRADSGYLLRLFCLRRTKKEVEVGLPPLLETRVECPLSRLQTFWYRRLLLRDSAVLAQVEKEEQGAVEGEAGPAAVSEAAEAGGWKKLQSLFMQLRKCCNHPYLFPDAEPHVDATAEDMVEASGKLMVLDRLLHQLYASGNRVVLFSQFTSMLDIFEDLLMLRGFAGRYSRLDGSVNRVQRTVDIAEFNRAAGDSKDTRPFCFLLSTRAGGLGVNLQTADTVILYDSDWNPQVDLQVPCPRHSPRVRKRASCLMMEKAEKSKGVRAGAYPTAVTSAVVYAKARGQWAWGLSLHFTVR